MVLRSLLGLCAGAIACTVPVNTAPEVRCNAGRGCTAHASAASVRYLGGVGEHALLTPHDVLPVNVTQMRAWSAMPESDVVPVLNELLPQIALTRTGVATDAPSTYMRAFLYIMHRSLLELPTMLDENIDDELFLKWLQVMHNDYVRDPMGIGFGGHAGVTPGVDEASEHAVGRLRMREVGAQSVTTPAMEAEIIGWAQKKEDPYLKLWEGNGGSYQRVSRLEEMLSKVTAVQDAGVGGALARRWSVADYAQPETIPAAIHAARRLLLEALKTPDQGAAEAKIMEAYSWLISRHPFPTRNNSFFWAIIFAPLGLKEMRMIPPLHFDHAAFRLKPRNAAALIVHDLDSIGFDLKTWRSDATFREDWMKRVQARAQQVFDGR